MLIELSPSAKSQPPKFQARFEVQKRAESNVLFDYKINFILCSLNSKKNPFPVIFPVSL